MSKNLSKSGWLARANCRTADHKLFVSYDPEDIREAKRICSTCEVTKQCKKEFYIIDCVAGGTTMYDRLLGDWQRIEKEDDNNWR